MRTTSQRSLILKYLREAKTHPTAAIIYNEMRQQLPNISFGTVYRNLGVLRDQGLIQELKFTDITHFDGNPSSHYHFLCRACGKVEDIEMEPRDSLIAEAQKVTDAAIEFHHVKFVGRCSSCRRQKGGDNGDRR